MKSKILCVCQYGHSRSVALSRILHHRNISAIAMGWQTAGDAIDVGCQWADKIAVLESSYLSRIPEQHRDKVVIVDVGKDIWSNPHNADLLTKCERLAIQSGLISE